MKPGTIEERFRTGAVGKEDLLDLDGETVWVDGSEGRVEPL